MVHAGLREHEQILVFHDRRSYNFPRNKANNFL